MEEKRRELPPPGQELERRYPAMEAPAQMAYGPAYGYSSEGMEEPEGAGLLEYWRMLRRRKGTLLLIAFLGVLAATLISLPQTPVYQARASVEVQALNSNYLNMQTMNPMGDANPWDPSFDVQTQIKILQSESLLERTMEKLKVQKAGDLKPQAGRVSVWRKALNLPEPNRTKEEDAEAALEEVAASVKVRASGQTRIIEILADSTEPARAADFANALAEEYIDQNVQARWEMTQRTAGWLGRQLEEMRIKLEKSEDALQAYARQSGLLYTGTGDKDKQNISEEKLRQLQDSLSKAQAERVGRQSRLEMARTAPAETLPDVLNDPALREYQTKLTDLRRQEAELTATYTPEYGKVRRVQAQIAPIEAALARERKAILDRIKNEYNEAVQREKLLAADYSNQAKLVTQESAKAVQYNILRREADSHRQIYDAMLQRVKESSVASAMRASNVRVVDRAKAPRFPYKPRIVLNAALGLLSGLFLGVALIVLRERADRTMQEPGDADFYLNVPELGVIPNATEKGKLRLYYRRRKALAENGDKAAEDKKPAPGASEWEQPGQVELTTWQRKPSMVAESFRVVLTSILFSGKNGDHPQVLVLTSANPREGKTTLACNLAIAMAEIKQKVLLVDADLRKPRVHEVFELENGRGLTNLLEENPLTDEALAGVVQQTKIPCLFVLPSGPATAAASNLLHSPNFGALVERFRKEFAMVLIDTPPALQMPDARVAGRLADGVILVTRAGKTTRDSALAARQRFNKDNTRVLGTILNYWDPHRTPGGNYGYYKGYSYYGKGYGYHGYYGYPKE